MKKLYLAAAALALLAGAPALQAQETNQTATMQADVKVDTQTFIDAASSSNLFEIQSSQLALQSATSDDVKAFAQHMVNDHTKAAEDMKAALSQVDMTAANKEPALLPKHAALLETLQGTSGEEFEKSYVMLQAQAHQEAVALFSNYAESGDAPALREFAKATLPTLQKHAEEVNELAAKHQG